MRKHPKRPDLVNEVDVGYQVTRAEVVMLPSTAEAIAADAFDAYATRLKSFAYASTRDADSADDIVQETFFRLVREVRAGRVPDSVGSWLYRVASNLLASRGRHASVVERTKSRLFEPDLGRSPEETVVGREHDLALLDALQGLPQVSRLAVLMAANGLTSAEVAEAIGRSAGATRTLICRARLRLREDLASREERPR
jgi:RNA polymerase sigma factor (sigma-70 family)